MTTSDIIRALDAVDSRNALIKFLKQWHAPDNASNEERARLTAAVVAAAARCWRAVK